MKSTLPTTRRVVADLREMLTEMHSSLARINRPGRYECATLLGVRRSLPAMHQRVSCMN
jgi:hypothetical protein